MKRNKPTEIRRIKRWREWSTSCVAPRNCVSMLAPELTASPNGESFLGARTRLQSEATRRVPAFSEWLRKNLAPILVPATLFPRLRIR